MSAYRPDPGKDHFLIASKGQRALAVPKLETDDFWSESDQQWISVAVLIENVPGFVPGIFYRRKYQPTPPAVKRETAQLRARKDDDRFHWIMAHCTEAVEIYEEHIEGYNPPIPPVTDAEAVVVQLRAKLTAAEATVAAKDVELAVLNKKQRDDLLFLNDAYRRATPQAELATLRTRLDTAREALEKTHAAFKHWEGEPVSTGHYNELIWAKEAVAAALSSIREGEK